MRATGSLSLPPGNYTVKLKIYEDGGKRTLIYGSVTIRVDRSMVATPQPYVPEGGGKGRSAPETQGGGFMPGFEGVAVLAAIGAISATVGANLPEMSLSVHAAVHPNTRPGCETPAFGPARPCDTPRAESVYWRVVHAAGVPSRRVAWGDPLSSWAVGWSGTTRGLVRITARMLRMQLR